MRWEFPFDAYVPNEDELRADARWLADLSHSLRCHLAAKLALEAEATLIEDRSAAGRVGRMVSGRCVIESDGDADLSDLQDVVIETGYLSGDVRFSGSHDAGRPSGSLGVAPATYGSMAQVTVPFDAFAANRHPVEGIASGTNEWLKGPHGMPAAAGLLDARTVSELDSSLRGQVACTDSGTLYVDLYFSGRPPGREAVLNAVCSAATFRGASVPWDRAAYEYLELPGQAADVR